MKIFSLKLLRYGGFALAVLFAASFAIELASGAPYAAKVLNSLGVVVGAFLPFGAAMLISIAAGKRLKRSVEHGESQEQRPIIGDRAFGGVGIALIVFACVVFLFRYQVTSAGSGVAYRTDRLTGESFLLAGTREVKLERSQP